MGIARDGGIGDLLANGVKATAEVWDSPTGLEWTVPSPAPLHTFDEPPLVGPVDMDSLGSEVQHWVCANRPAGVAQ